LIANFPILLEGMSPLVGLGGFLCFQLKDAISLIQQSLTNQKVLPEKYRISALAAFENGKGHTGSPRGTGSDHRVGAAYRRFSEASFQHRIKRCVRPPN
jgi:hypothetical protein